MKTNTETAVSDSKQLEFALRIICKPKQIEMFAELTAPPKPSDYWFTPRPAKGRGKVLLPPKRYKQAL